MLEYIGLFLFVVSLLIMFNQGAHFLRVLLVMELITLSLFFLSIICLGGGFRFSGISFAVIFLTFGVYEAVNGLGLLVSRTRASGLDQLRGLFRLSF